MSTQKKQSLVISIMGLFSEDQEEETSVFTTGAMKRATQLIFPQATTAVACTRRTKKDGWPLLELSTVNTLVLLSMKFIELYGDAEIK